MYVTNDSKQPQNELFINNKTGLGIAGFGKLEYLKKTQLF